MTSRHTKAQDFVRLALHLKSGACSPCRMDDDVTIIEGSGPGAVAVAVEGSWAMEGRASSSSSSSSSGSSRTVDATATVGIDVFRHLLTIQTAGWLGRVHSKHGGHSLGKPARCRSLSTTGVRAMFVMLQC